MRSHVAVLAAAFLLLTPLTARSQTSEVAGRVRLSIDGGRQTTKTSFEGRHTFEDFVEPGSLTLTRVIPGGTFFDVGVGVRVWNGLTAGVTLSYFSDSGTGTVSAQLPHPFHFNQPRSVTGEASNLERRETAGHFQVGWILPLGGFDLTLTAGPSIFRTEQGFVTEVEYAQEYPYDTAELRSVSTEPMKGSLLGYNAGADLTWRLTSHVGLGGLVRLARAKKEFRPSSGDVAPIKSGGVHAGVGLRLLF